MIYLDHAATTPLSQSAIKAMTRVMAEGHFGNPSSLHTYGRKAKELLRQARSSIATALDTKAEHIIFTSGGSEANNLAIKGYALANQDKGKHLITSAFEHHSILDVMAYLETRFGFEVTYLKPENGTITAQQVSQALRDDTILVSLMAINNETGAILPTAAIGQVLADHQAVFHVDAVQAVGKIPVQPDQWQVDFLSASAHKFHGPKGVGFLYAKSHPLDRLIHGGNQEDQKRAGTENLTGLVGMAQALTDSLSELPQDLETVKQLREHFLAELADLPYYLNNSTDTLPHIINIGFPNKPNQLLLTQLDLAGFAVSTGSACTAGAIEPSHVLASIYGTNSERLTESIRISISESNTPEELSKLAQTLKNLIKR